MSSRADSLTSKTRKRSNTARSLQPSTSLASVLGPVPVPPPALNHGDRETLVLWVHDDRDQDYSRDVIVNPAWWPGLAHGDMLLMKGASPSKENEKGFLFIVPNDAGDTKSLSAQLQISISKTIADAFKWRNQDEVVLTKVNPTTHTASHLSLLLTDPHLSRADMWRLARSLVGQCVHTDQPVSFLSGNNGAVVGKVGALYVGGKKTSAAHITPHTTPIFHSLSAKLNIFIHVCPELWHFAPSPSPSSSHSSNNAKSSNATNDRFSSLLTHAFLPALLHKWKSTGANHLLSVVLVARVFYSESEAELLRERASNNGKKAKGPKIMLNEENRYYKDFYRVLFEDLELAQETGIRGVVAGMEDAVRAFGRDVVALSNSCAIDAERGGREGEDEEGEIPKTIGTLASSAHFPLLECINLSLSPSPSLSLSPSLSQSASSSTTRSTSTSSSSLPTTLSPTTSSVLLITPSTPGYFRVERELLRITTRRVIEDGGGGGGGVRVVCLGGRSVCAGGGGGVNNGVREGERGKEGDSYGYGDGREGRVLMAFWDEENTSQGERERDGSGDTVMSGTGASISVGGSFKEKEKEKEPVQMREVRALGEGYKSLSGDVKGEATSKEKGAKKKKRLVYWDPFWLPVVYWGEGPPGPSGRRRVEGDRFTPHAQIYSIQMLSPVAVEPFSVPAHQVPYLDSNSSVDVSRNGFTEEEAEEYDNNVFGSIAPQMVKSSNVRETSTALLTKAIVSSSHGSIPSSGGSGSNSNSNSGTLTASTSSSLTNRTSTISGTLYERRLSASSISSSMTTPTGPGGGGMGRSLYNRSSMVSLPPIEDSPRRVGGELPEERESLSVYAKERGHAGGGTRTPEKRGTMEEVNEKGSATPTPRSTAASGAGSGAGSTFSSKFASAWFFNPFKSGGSTSTSTPSASSAVSPSQGQDSNASNTTSITTPHPPSSYASSTRAMAISRPNAGTSTPTPMSTTTTTRPGSAYYYDNMNPSGSRRSTVMLSQQSEDSIAGAGLGLGGTTLSRSPQTQGQGLSRSPGPTAVHLRESRRRDTLSSVSSFPGNVLHTHTHTHQNLHSPSQQLQATSGSGFLLNPLRRASMGAQSTSQAARACRARWEGLYVRPSATPSSANATSKDLIKSKMHIQNQTAQAAWTSLITPASLPLTTEYLPSRTELEREYDVFSYDFVVDPREMRSFFVKAGVGGFNIINNGNSSNNSNLSSSASIRGREREHLREREIQSVREHGVSERERQEWAVVLMRGMAALRLAQGFQFVVRASSRDSSVQTQAHHIRGQKEEQQTHERPPDVSLEKRLARASSSSIYPHNVTVNVYADMSINAALAISPSEDDLTPRHGGAAEILVDHTIGTAVGGASSSSAKSSGSNANANANANAYIKDPVYLSVNNEIHRIAYKDEAVQVRRYVRRVKGRESGVEIGGAGVGYGTIGGGSGGIGGSVGRPRQCEYEYSCMISAWPKLRDGDEERFEEVRVGFGRRGLESYNWNRVDMLVAGYEHLFNESLRYCRTRFVVVPTIEAPPPMTGPSGEKLNPEEVRLLGTDKLAELFSKVRWVCPSDRATATQYPPVRFLPTDLGPTICILDEHLVSQLEEVHAEGPGGKNMKSERVLSELSLSAVAKAMREDSSNGGLVIKDHKWHGNVWQDSFTGYDFVSWLLREFRDVSTREQGVEAGMDLHRRGLIEHCRKMHGFLDGHYFYRLRGEYAIPSTPSRKWFQTTKRNTPAPEEKEMRSPFISSGISKSARRLKEKKRLVLSQTMVIDADYQKKSDQAESVILHYDLIHNPANVFHFELNWIGTTARCIEELLRLWNRTIEKYGLKLVEAYVTQICDIRERNPFQSCFPLRLALAPPSVLELEIAKRFPAPFEGATQTLTTHYFEYQILQRFNFVLDTEAASLYPDRVDVFYSYRHSPYSYSQFVHRTGAAFIQILGGQEGFLFLANKLMAPGRMGTSYRGKWPSDEAEELRKQLYDFCSDEKKLQEFYEELIAKLPPLPHAVEEPPELTL